MYRETIETIVNYIHSKGLAVPAIFALELHKPLAGLASVAFSASRPVIDVLFGKSRFAGIEEILQSSDRIEELIVAIESRKFKERGEQCKE